MKNVIRGDCAVTLSGTTQVAAKAAKGTILRIRVSSDLGVGAAGAVPATERRPKCLRNRRSASAA
jgi:hypothetical protein